MIVMIFFCFFINNVYIIGGFMYDDIELATCFKLKTKSLKWKEMSSMNNAKK